MSHSMKLRKLNNLKDEYTRIEAHALRLMKAGDLKKYIKTLIHARKIRVEYAELFTA